MPSTLTLSTTIRRIASTQVTLFARAGQAPEVPAAEEQDHDQESRRDHVQVLAHQVHHQLDAEILGVIAADQFLLALGQVEGQAAGLGKGGDAEDHHPQRLHEGVPGPRLRLLLHDRVQSQRTRS